MNLFSVTGVKAVKYVFSLSYGVQAHRKGHDSQHFIQKVPQISLVS